MSDNQIWVLIGCAVVGAASLFFIAHNAEKLVRNMAAITDLLRQIRNLLEK